MKIINKTKRKSIQELSFHNVGFSYPGQEALFKNLSFTFTLPHPIILQGPLGCGKHTILKILLGIIPVTEGEYLINGESVKAMSYSELDNYRLSLGGIFEGEGLLHNRTLWENLKLPLDYHDLLPREEREKFLLEHLERFEIQEYKDLRPAQVSSGVKKVVGLIRAFLFDPEILVLDHPTLGAGAQHLGPLLELIRHHQNHKNLKHLICLSEDREFIHHLGARVYEVSSSNFRLIATPGAESLKESSLYAA